jgi:hypothetical protein
MNTACQYGNWTCIKIVHIEDENLEKFEESKQKQ